ncbi:MAG: hypothetical protein JO210_07880 [Acidobacteriaceae bacterium]|nr:hypothetical protein [Acidobacteriaceae bacterium]
MELEQTTASDNVLMTGMEPGRLDKPVVRAKWKIFDPRDTATSAGGAELLDATVIKRGNRWWMYLAGQAAGYGATDIYTASLSQEAPLSPTGWTPTHDAYAELVPLATRNASHTWDGHGGRHCPSYVKGWDPNKRKWVERLYYAGSAQDLWGPYSIGYLEWDGERWVDQNKPAFVAEHDWERGSVYEPNLIYHDGRWKLWYVAGSNQDDYLVHGYSESQDGCTGWSTHSIFAPPEMKMFDFCVRQRRDGWHAVFSRVWVKESPPPPETGLWWCRANTPSESFSDWGQPVQIMTSEGANWHSGPWKPCLVFQEGDLGEALLFFDGLYRTNDPGPFPFAFTLGCLELELP